MTIFFENWGEHGPFGPPWLRLWVHLLHNFAFHLLLYLEIFSFVTLYLQSFYISCNC